MCHINQHYSTYLCRKLIFKLDFINNNLLDTYHFDDINFKYLKKFKNVKKHSL